MNKKIKRIITFSVLGVLGIVYGVFYIINPENTKKVTESVLDYISNKPLPVVGISILTLGFIVIRILKMSGFGNKQIQECKKDLKQSKEDREKTHEELLAFEERIEQRFDAFELDNNDKMGQICSSIPNKKVNDLGEKFYGERKESINNDTEKE